MKRMMRIAVFRSQSVLGLFAQRSRHEEEQAKSLRFAVLSMIAFRVHYEHKLAS